MAWNFCFNPAWNISIFLPLFASLLVSEFLIDFILLFFLVFMFNATMNGLVMRNVFPWKTTIVLFFGCLLFCAWEPVMIHTHFDFQKWDFFVEMEFLCILSLECYFHAYYYAQLLCGSCNWRVLSAICNRNKNFNINCNMFFMTGYHITAENRHKWFCNTEILCCFRITKTTILCIILLLWFLVSLVFELFSVSIWATAIYRGFLIREISVFNSNLEIDCFRKNSPLE